MVEGGSRDHWTGFLGPRIPGEGMPGPRESQFKGLGGLLAGTRQSGQLVSWSEAPGLAEGAAGPGAGALGPGGGGGPRSSCVSEASVESYTGDSEGHSRSTLPAGPSARSPNTTFEVLTEPTRLRLKPVWLGEGQAGESNFCDQR